MSTNFRQLPMNTFLLRQPDYIQLYHQELIILYLLASFERLSLQTCVLFSQLNKVFRPFVSLS